MEQFAKRNMSGRQRNIRSKRASAEEEDDAPAAGSLGAAAGEQPECLRDKLEETKLIQKMRKKSAGMLTDKLALAGPSAVREASEEPEDPDTEHVARLMDSYVKETAVRETDEDEHMQKFVEIELAKRLGKRAAGEELDEGEQRRRRIDADLYSIPEHLQTVQQDVPLAGMMTGISEMVLPMEDRLRKIEETEAVKRRMLSAASRRAHLPVDGDDRRAAPAPEKMRRSACPVVFGKPQERRCDKDADELEVMRRRVVSEKRPLVTKGRGKGR